MHCLARETILASKECPIIGCSHELSNEFVLDVMLFRTNKFGLYFVNNNSSFHSKHFIKFHQFIAAVGSSLFSTDSPELTRPSLFRELCIGEISIWPLSGKMSLVRGTLAQNTFVN